MPLSKRYVAVGDSTEVGIGLNIGRSARKISKSPRVSTSDPGQGDLTIKLEADVVAGFDSTTPATIHPQRIDIPPDKRDAEYMLVIKNVSDGVIEPRIVSEQPGVLDIILPEGPMGPGEEKAIYVKIDKDFDKLAHKTSFTMDMSDAALTRYTIPVEIGTSGGQVTRSRAPQTKQPATAKADNEVIRPTTTKTKTGGK
jgi:hypothetical protein